MKINERRAEDLAMSWENVRAIFPYGLPASLQSSDQQPSNVINFEQWCQHHRKEMERRRTRPHP